MTSSASSTVEGALDAVMAVFPQKMLVLQTFIIYLRLTKTNIYIKHINDEEDF